MSTKELGRLFQDLEENPELTRELEEASDGSAFVAVATRHGYEVSEDELRTSVALEKSEGELSDEQLERVAGGMIDVGGTARRFPALQRLGRNLAVFEPNDLG